MRPVEDLIVDHHEARLPVRILQDFGFRVRSAATVERALELLHSAVRLRAPLRLIVSDILHSPRNPVAGIKFVRQIRQWPSEATVGGGLRVRHLPIVVLSSLGYKPRNVQKLAEIDSDIPVVKEIARDTDVEFARAVSGVLAEYRSRLLRELHHLGYGIVWNGSSYSVLPAYVGRLGQMSETALFAGEPTSLADVYGKLLLMEDAGHFGEAALAEFETLLDHARSERDFHRFFDRHPHFLYQDEFDAHWSEPVLRSYTALIRPDFVLQSRTRAATARWAVADLKRPAVPLLAHQSFHADFSRHVYRVVAQLRDYSDFFHRPENEELLRQKFGGVVPRPKLVAIIGRFPSNRPDDYARLQRRLPDIKLTTYDELLVLRRAKIDWIRAATRTRLVRN